MHFFSEETMLALWSNLCFYGPPSGLSAPSRMSRVKSQSATRPEFVPNQAGRIVHSLLRLQVQAATLESKLKGPGESQTSALKFTIEQSVNKMLLLRPKLRFSIVSFDGTFGSSGVATTADAAAA